MSYRALGIIDLLMKINDGSLDSVFKVGTPSTFKNQTVISHIEMK